MKHVSMVLVELVKATVVFMKLKRCLLEQINLKPIFMSVLHIYSRLKFYDL